MPLLAGVNDGEGLMFVRPDNTFETLEAQRAAREVFLALDKDTGAASAGQCQAVPPHPAPPAPHAIRRVHVSDRQMP